MNRREALRAAREERRRRALGAAENVSSAAPSSASITPPVRRGGSPPPSGPIIEPQATATPAAGEWRTQRRRPRRKAVAAATGPAAETALDQLAREKEQQRKHRQPADETAAREDTRGPEADTVDAAALETALVIDNSAKLSQRIQERRHARDRAGQRLSERERAIQMNYASDILQQLDVSSGAAGSGAPSAPFSRDKWIASLIMNSRSNFLKIDEQLAVERTIARQQLHAAVFAHATDFMLLFREVEQASGVVESLKGVVQATKGLISTVGRFSLLSVLQEDAGAAGGTQLTGRATGGGEQNLMSIGAAATAATARHRPAHYDSSSSSAHRHGGVGGILSGIDWTAPEDSTASGNRAHGGGSTDAPATAGGALTVELPRPSLITRRLWQQHEGSAPPLCSPAATATSAGASRDNAGAAVSAGAAGPSGGGAVSLSRASTRLLHVDSFMEWRHRIGAVDLLLDYADQTQGDDGSDTNSRPAGTPLGRTQPRGSSGNHLRAVLARRQQAEQEVREAQLFAVVLREELEQLLAERRYHDAAAALFDVHAEAQHRLCLPLLLQLESALVNATLSNLRSIPLSPLYIESLHVPLLQLLLRFGRQRISAVAYLELQTTRLQWDLRGLQSHLDPKYASRMLMDYVLKSVKDTADRQRTLHLPLEAFQRYQREQQDGGGAAAEGSASSKPVAKAGKKGKGKKICGGGLPLSGQTSSAPLLPLNAATLLWVRGSVQAYAEEVLHCCVLSQSTEADGAVEPTRLRRAVVTTVEILSVLRRTAETHPIFDGCDALALRSLTNNVAALQTEFTHRTRQRLQHIATSMMTQAIGDVVALHAAASSSPPSPPGSSNPNEQQPAHLKFFYYDPAACEDAARSGLLYGQSVWRQLRHLPPSACVGLLGLALSPATCYLFDRDWLQTFGRRWWLRGREVFYWPTAAPPSPPDLPAGESAPTVPCAAVDTLLPLEVFSFLRYTNSPTPVVCQLLEAVLLFVAATAGTAQLPQHPLHGASPPPEGATRKNIGGGDAPGICHQRVRSNTVAGTVPSQRSSQAPHATVEALRFQQQLHCAENMLQSALVADSLDRSVASLLESRLHHLRAAKTMVLSFLCSRGYSAFRQQQRGLRRASNTGGARRPPAHATAPSVSMTAGRRRSSVAVLTEAAGDGAPIPPEEDNEEDEDDEEAEGHGNHNASARSRTDTGVPLPILLPPLPGGGAQPLLTDFLASPAWVMDVLSALLSDGITVAVMAVYASTGAGVGMLLGDTSFAFRTKYLSRLAVCMPQVIQGWMALTWSLGRSVRDGLRSLHADEGKANIADSNAAGETASGKAHGLEALLPSLCLTHAQEQRMLRAVLTDVLGEPYQTPVGYSIHRYLPMRSTRPAPAPAPGPQQGSEDGVAGGGQEGAGRDSYRHLYRAGVWVVRRHLTAYPSFPIGNATAIPRDDELFFLHWATQSTLHLLTVFQERLLLPAYVTNKRFMEHEGRTPGSAEEDVALPVRGCPTPQEPEGKLAFFSGGGGGHYVSAVGLLQFLVLRLFRDGLCRASTWTAVYGCESAEGWRGKDDVLRQQVFFFGLMLRMWSPLFVDGLDPAPARTNPNPTGPIRFPSDVHKDGHRSALEVLQWLTCREADTTSGISQPLHPPGGSFRTAGSPSVAGAGSPAGRLHTTMAFPTAGAGAEGGAGGVATATHNAVEENPWSAPSSVSSPLLPSSDPHLSPRSTDGAAGGSRMGVAPVLLLAVRRWFEDQLREFRAVPAILSATTAQRVERAMHNIDLKDFMGVQLESGGDDDDGESDEEMSDDDDDDDDDEEEVEALLGGTTRHAAGGGGEGHKKSSSAAAAEVEDGMPLRLEDLRDLLVTYVLPLL